MFINPDTGMKEDAGKPVAKTEAVIPNSAPKVARKIKAKQTATYGGPAMPAEAYMQENPWGNLGAPTQADIGQASLQTPVMPQVPNAPGGFAEAKNSMETTSKSGEKRNIRETPEQINANLEALMNTRLYKDQVSIADKLNEENQRALASVEPQLDISPLVSLVDQWTGSKLAQSYKKPVSKMEKAAMAIKAAEDEAKRRSDINKDLFTNYTKFKEGESQQGLTQKIAEMLTSGVKPPPQMNPASLPNLGVRISKDANKIYQDYKDSIQRIDLSRQAISTGQFGEIRRNLAVIAREISGEKGVLTDSDISRVLPNTVGMDAAKLQTYLESNPNILVSPQITQALLKDLDRAKDRKSKDVQNKLKTYKESLGAATQGKLDLEGIFNPMSVGISEASRPAEPSKQSQDIMNLLREALKK